MLLNASLLRRGLERNALTGTLPPSWSAMANLLELYAGPPAVANPPLEPVFDMRLAVSVGPGWLIDTLFRAE
jgi:hypothetical protein